MPLKELSISEQIRILEDLDNQEKIFDRNLSLAKGDVYSLKHKYNIDVEPQPLQMMQEVYRQQPTIDAIKSISKQLTDARPAIPQIGLMDIDSKAKEEPISVASDEEDKDSVVLRKHNFPTMNEVENRNLDVADLIVKISNYNKSVLGVKLATLTRSGRKDNEEYQAIQGEVQVLKNFKARLLDNFDRQRVLLERIGSGLKVGKYYADVGALKRGVLKLRKKNKSIIKGVNDVKVTEGVKQLLLKRFNPKVQYSEDDYKKYHEICELTGHRPKKHSRLRDKIYVTNVLDAQKRLIHAIGEIKAGNNNPGVFNEIVDLGDFLLKQGKLTKSEYEDLIDYINEGSNFSAT